MIVPDLQSLAFPIAQLDPMPGNPRRGDVDAVARSYDRFGQRKPVVARKQGKRGIVIAGNHQLEAAKQLGWNELAVVWVKDDDTTAAAFALADNRTADLGTYDAELLFGLVDMVKDDAALLEATSYTLDDLDDLAARVSPPSLDDLAAKWGEPDPKALWPVIRLQVDPLVRDRWANLPRQHDDETDEDVFERLISLAEQAE